MSIEVKSGILIKNGEEYFPVTHASLVEGLSPIATSGSYEDLTDKPEFATTEEIDALFDEGESGGDGSSSNGSSDGLSGEYTIKLVGFLSQTASTFEGSDPYFGQAESDLNIRSEDLYNYLNDPSDYPNLNIRIVDDLDRTISVEPVTFYTGVEAGVIVDIIGGEGGTPIPTVRFTIHIGWYAHSLRIGEWWLEEEGQ